MFAQRINESHYKLTQTSPQWPSSGDVVINHESQ